MRFRQCDGRSVQSTSLSKTVRKVSLSLEKNRMFAMLGTQIVEDVEEIDRS